MPFHLMSVVKHVCTRARTPKHTAEQGQPINAVEAEHFAVFAKARLFG